VGSLRAISDSSGTVVKQVDYDSFGNVITDTLTTMTVPFGFAGGLYDYDVGLTRFGFRDYDPSIGRWTAKDPIDFAGGDVNLFAYVHSDPVNFVDFLGLTEKCPTSPPSAGDPKWIPYGDDGDSDWFHCGYIGFHENRKATPDNPIAECFYDEKGSLVGKDHKFEGCKGSPNQRPDLFGHIFRDSGGIFSKAGACGFFDSRKKEILEHDVGDEFLNY
jgi:RHS repeat-associated protein